ncbi:sigma-70 family RNA polymerase sigma factor [Novosphingobium sp. 1949]|uniref:Sigma-70 family RNA polymerase sigma factor n=1 Tax=Novosphingobium organovorum TaxID=2930092 RepID=A0ABT0BBY9_9SPHN|nr:sigma-70 family RNA polymerase sigma factor [Novosphingobium organovorum]MCJ2182561.1 sigma-70 family RNA polymerase sigma factor [Novosphingobium organovorum]
MSEADAIKVFLSAHGALLRYAERLTGSLTDAEDLVQEAWLRFRPKTRSEALEEPVRYLFRIVHNLARDRQRRHGRESRLFAPADADVQRVASPQPSPAMQAEASDELATARRALEALPERTRRAFEMHRFEGRKLVEIAVHLGISKSRASELVIEALEACKSALRRP